MFFYLTNNKKWLLCSKERAAWLGIKIMEKHKHLFKTKHSSIVAEFKKGSREETYIQGNYEECSVCGEGRFVPLCSEYQIVPCEKIDLKS